MTRAWEDWELTAFALGELPEDRRAAIQSEIDTNPELQTELAAIRQAIQVTTDALRFDTAVGLSQSQQQAVSEAIAQAASPQAVARASSHSKVHASRARWTSWVGMAAVAACLFIAISFATWEMLGTPGDRIAKNIVPESEAVTRPTSPDTVQMSQAASPTSEPASVAAATDVKKRESVALRSKASPSRAELTTESSQGMVLKDDVQSTATDNFSHMDRLAVLGDAEAETEKLQQQVRALRVLEETVVEEKTRAETRVDDFQATTYFRTLSKRGREQDLDLVEGMLGREDSKLSSQSGDKFAAIEDNPFRSARRDPLSTFSIDVDTASYSKVRQYVMEHSQLPTPSSVRIEELMNYFPYDYAGPVGDQPFASSMAVARCPWNPDHRLVRVAIQAKKIADDKRPLSNLVFLLDVSGSMNEPNKLPLVKQAIRMLVGNLGENDRVAMVVYAGAAGLVLESTLGSDQSKIMSAVDRLSAGGSTNGGEGIQLAYQLAREHFVEGGTNRVVLCTDGDFNVGLTGTDELVKLVEENAKSKIFLTVLGFGMGNTNDEMLEKISNRGNGIYGFIDNEREARKMMIEQLTGSLVTVAKDVKIQVEFNPVKVDSYRLIGYENRVMAAEDFNDDKKDAGDIGAGHQVTALYEIVPAKGSTDEPLPELEDLRYQSAKSLKSEATESNELMIVKMRYKQPEGTASVLQEFPVVDQEQALRDCDRDFRWAASVAQFGMLLRKSPHLGQGNWDALLESAQEAAGEKPDVYRQEALEVFRRAAALAK